jgi:hypothetical protein
MARTSISVDLNVFEEFSAQAKLKDKTLFAFANESLSTVSRISAEGGDPSELYDLWRMISLLKQVDVITLPSEFVDELIAKQYATDREGLLRMFSELGSRLVGILKIAARDIDGLAELGRDFVMLLPLKQLKISKSPDGDGIEIQIVGAGRRIESTECSYALLQSILNGYGYTVTKREINIGTIMAWASKRKFA